MLTMDQISIYLYLFYADDAKLFSFIKTMEDSATLQKDLDSWI